MVNEYIIHLRISEAKTREVIRYFACDIEASKIADLTSISRNTIKIFKAIRERMTAICERDSLFEVVASKWMSATSEQDVSWSSRPWRKRQASCVWTH